MKGKKKNGMITIQTSTGFKGRKIKNDPFKELDRPRSDLFLAVCGIDRCD